jgi:hypothetical protein
MKRKAPFSRRGVEQSDAADGDLAVSGSRRAAAAIRWGGAARELPPIRIGGTSAPGASVIDAPDGVVGHVPCTHERSGSRVIQ